MDTKTLIDRLAADAVPVRPLPPPWVRTLAWLALSIASIALVVFVMSPRSDLSTKFSEWRFVIELSAALLTGVMAALAAFLSVIPGTARTVPLLPLLPLVPLAVWLASVSHSCMFDWIRLGAAGLELHSGWACVKAAVITSALPAIAIAVMLRRGAPLVPVATAALGALGAAGIGSAGLRLFHPQDAGIMILVWQIGSAGLFTVLAGLGGRYIFCWNSRIRQSCRHLAVQ